MKIIVSGLALAGLVIVTASPAVAIPHRHRIKIASHRHVYIARRAPSFGYLAAYPAGYQGYEFPGAIIEEATERAQGEPGVTSELSPGARQTATGGPVGGVPGFSGGR